MNSEKLYPEMEEIEGLALAELEKEEDQIDAEDEKMEEEIEGIGDLGRRRSYRRRHKTTRRKKRRSSRRRSVRKAYSSGANSTAVKTGLVKGLTSRGQFELRKSALPKDVQDGLAKGTLQPCDAAIYAIKDISGKSNIELLAASDDKKAGVTNLNRAQLDNGKYFLLTEVVLEYAKGADAADNDPSKFEFGQSALPAEILNGTFEMKQGSRVIVPELSCGIFDDTDTTQRSYCYKLANPKFLVPSVEIIPEVKLSTVLDSDTIKNPALKITLIGTWVEKA